MAQDETDKLRARIGVLEAKLARAEQAHRLAAELVEHAPVCIQAYDASGTSVLMNTAQQRFLGVTDRRAPRKFNVLRDPAAKDAGIDRLFLRAYQGELVSVPEFEVDLSSFGSEASTRRSSRWYEQLIFPINDEQGRVEAVGSFHWEITRRKEMETALIRAQRQESLALLAGGIAHDFNNLLLGILGNASLALLDVGDNEPVDGCLREIQDAAEAAADLTRQLLAYAGKGRFLTRPVHVSSVVREMDRLLHLSLPPQVEVELDLEDDIEAVHADISQLRQVVMNLLKNAGEAIGDHKGKIVVRTAMADLEPANVTDARAHEVARPGRYVQLEVIDNGEGMNEATIQRIFDPFYTKKKTGHGLGLAATLGIVKAHRGGIRVDSEPGGGTNMTVWFPARGTYAVEDIDDEGEPTNAEDSDATILVVDDDEKVRTFATRALERQGYTVLRACDGADAVHEFRERQAEISLIFLDLSMPVMGGAAAFREIRKLDKDVPVLLTSGFNEEDSLSEFADSSIEGFLQKPFRAQTLIDRVSAILAKKSLAGAATARRP